jgi:hypothetical protein
MPVLRKPLQPDLLLAYHHVSLLLLRGCRSHALPPVSSEGLVLGWSTENAVKEGPKIYRAIDR